MLSRFYNIVDKYYRSKGFKIEYYKAQQIKGEYAIEIEPFFVKDKIVQ